jgi:hypothetical protein
VIFADGRVFSTRCVAADNAQDVALLQVIAEEGSTELPAGTRFESVSLAAAKPEGGSAALCIGNPACSGFKPFGCSVGKIQQSGGDTGAGGSKLGLGGTKHSCWTYWGHSGAPLFGMLYVVPVLYILLLMTCWSLTRRWRWRWRVRGSTGTDQGVVAMHNSWDDSRRGQRHAVSWAALRSFLAAHV